MKKKINASLFLSLFSVLLFGSCDKENINKEFGQYAVAVSYLGNDFLQLHFLIDGKECGQFVPVPNINPSYVEDCSVLRKPDNLTNVFVLKKIPVGKHDVEIRTESGTLIKKLQFEMINKECVFQNLEIELD
ncbi:MAG: hypothetical protein ACO1N4_01830 [Pedobacter sp.]